MEASKVKSGAIGRVWTDAALLALSFLTALCAAHLAGKPAGAQASAGATARKSYRFVNGRWFDGKGFRRATFYAADGTFAKSPPPHVDETVDLADGFVVPPFGDAHTHNFDNPYTFKPVLKAYVDQGIFYAKVQGNFRSGAQQLAPQLNRADAVDVLYAHGALTSDFGHPIEIFEPVALGLFSSEQRRANSAKILTSRLAEGNAYYTLDSPSELERKWPEILAGKPDFIKVMLLHSEEYGVLPSPPKELGRRGLDPVLVPQVVARAHKADLRVSAHVESAADYHTALRAGVDEIAHLPGFYIPQNEDAHRYEVSAEDAKMTAHRGVDVVTTARLARNYEAMPAIYPRIRSTQIRNLHLLQRSGVRLAIGGDTYGETPLSEVTYLQELGAFSSLELLKMWCEDTPRVIFPARRIGQLRAGYEASFIVLRANPLADFGAVKAVALRFKQGRMLTAGS